MTFKRRLWNTIFFTLFIFIMYPVYAQNQIEIYNLSNPEPCSSKAIMPYVQGKCFSCDRKDVLSLFKERCDLCPNRTWIDGQCDLLPPKETPLRDKNLNYHSCDEPGPIEVAYGRDCLSCPNRTLLMSHYRPYLPAMCMENCPKDKPLIDQKGHCHSCNEQEDIEVNINSVKDYCAVCPNRHLTNGSHCKYIQDLPSKEEDVILIGGWDDNGKQVRCDYPNPIKLQYKEMCGLCKNRQLRKDGKCYLNCPKGSIFDIKNVCRSCEQSEKIVLSEEKNECPNRHILKMKAYPHDFNYFSYLKCPSDKPLMDRDGKCHPCDEPDMIFTNKTECDVCPKRKLKNEGTCSFCPPERPVMDIYGNCIKLEGLRGIEVGQGEKCGDDSKFKNYFGYCFQICPPDRPIPDYSGNCHSCDEEDAINLYFNEERVRGGYDNTSISSKFCGLCPNREIVLKTEWSDTKRLCVIKKSVSKAALKVRNAVLPWVWTYFFFSPITIPVTIIILSIIIFFIGRKKKN